MKIVIGCSGSKQLARKIASQLKSEYSDLEVNRFPDNELHIRFPKQIKGKEVIIVQSLHGNIDDKIIETLFAGYTARDLKAKKLVLIAPYLAYLRDDARFAPGECISARIIASLFKIFDKVYAVEPHLHRFHHFSEFFKNATRVSCVREVVNYIKKNIPNPIILGPDMESFQWSRTAAKLLGKKAIILKKKRFSSRKVKVTDLHKNVKGKNVIIIDDIISTGKTMLEVIKDAKRLGAKQVYCIAFHGVFSGNALKMLQKHAKIITTDTIPNKTSKISCVKSVVEAIK